MRDRDNYGYMDIIIANIYISSMKGRLSPWTIAVLYDVICFECILYLNLSNPLTLAYLSLEKIKGMFE